MRENVNFKEKREFEGKCELKEKMWILRKNVNFEGKCEFWENVLLEKKLFCGKINFEKKLFFAKKVENVNFKKNEFS